MSELLKAVQYKNLDEAQAVLREYLPELSDGKTLDDGGSEPQGLLSVVPEDRLPEEAFYKLFGLKKGTLIEVERIGYSGFGPPADEAHYMGFVTEEIAYVVKGCRYPIEIEDCPQKARDIHHLEALVMDSLHPLDAADLARRLGLSAEWDFDDLFDLISEGEITANEIDRLIHQGIQ